MRTAIVDLDTATEWRACEECVALGIEREMTFDGRSQAAKHCVAHLHGAGIFSQVPRVVKDEAQRAFFFSAQSSGLLKDATFRAAIEVIV